MIFFTKKGIFLGNRLKKLLDILKIRQNQFALSVDLSPSYISDMITGKKTGFSTETLVKITELYRVNLTWLLTGEGEMFVSASENEGISVQEQKVIEAYRKKTELQPAVNILLGVEEEADEMPAERQSVG
ncbi:MAG: helix-turn-helix domain-containing protein [Leptospirales bacterium]|nr:helix-turn-helix domain-containing protein [Leptospirales bacterium]